MTAAAIDDQGQEGEAFEVSPRSALALAFHRGRMTNKPVVVGTIVSLAGLDYRRLS